MRQPYGPGLPASHPIRWNGFGCSNGAYYARHRRSRGRSGHTFSPRTVNCTAMRTARELTDSFWNHHRDFSIHVGTRRIPSLVRCQLLAEWAPFRIFPGFGGRTTTTNYLSMTNYMFSTGPTMAPTELCTVPTNEPNYNNELNHNTPTRMTDGLPPVVCDQILIWSLVFDLLLVKFKLSSCQTRFLYFLCLIPFHNFSFLAF